MKSSLISNPFLGIFAVTICLVPALSMSAPATSPAVPNYSRLANGVDGIGDSGYDSAEGRTASFNTYDAEALSQPTENQNYFRSLLGTALYRTRKTCTNLNATTLTNSLNVFDGDIEFRTGPASTFVEIDYSAQVSVAAATVDNSLYVKCSVSQDGGTNWTTCSGQGANGIAMARGVQNGQTYSTNTSSGSYMGFVADLQPDTPTKVKLEAKLLNTMPAGTKNSTVCQNNVIIRY